MGFTREQFKEWVEETFPDNASRLIVENNFRDGLSALADFVFETNSAIFIQDSIALAEGFAQTASDKLTETEFKRAATEILYNLVANDKVSIELIKAQAQAIVDSALTATNPQGEWNAATNTPALTAIPIAGANGTHYDITVPGLAPFTGSNFTSGVTTLPVGAKLVKKSSTLWYMALPSDLALTKAIKLEKDTSLAELMTEIANSSSLNGAVSTSVPAVITIPPGSSGYQSALTKTMQLSAHTNWTVGKQLRFYVIFTESEINFHSTKININMNVFRSGAVSQNQATAQIRERIFDANTVRAQFDYTVQAGDVWVQPFVQILGSAFSNGTASDWVIALKDLYVEVLNPSTYTNKISEKFKSVDLNSATNTANIASNTAAITATGASIAAKIQNFSVIPTAFNGEALQGATGTATKRISIPAGQSAHTSYIRAVLPISEFSNWPDMVGIPVTFQFKMLMSDDLFPWKGISALLNVMRSGAYIDVSTTAKTITKISAKEFVVKFNYTPDMNDTIIRPYVQIQSGSPNNVFVADGFLEMSDITYSHAIPTGYSTENTYQPAKDRVWYNAKIAALIARATSLETQLATVSSAAETVITVSPDGTKNFLSPKLANDSILDSTKAKPYKIVVFPGTYTETEWIVKPFTTVEGVHPELCWLKGELPESSTDALITNTSTIWLKKTSAIKNLKITCKNMRYAVHSEESGLALDSMHNVYNCRLVHYGNNAARDWRNANPGSGMLASTVWGSARPYGYGASSGEVETYENCTFESPIEAYYVHNNKDFTKPNINTATNCNFYCALNFGQVVEIQSLGSGTADVVDLRNCDFSAGFVDYSDSPWITIDEKKQYANHAEYTTNISGHKTPLGFKNSTRGLALRISSNNIVGASNVRVSGTAAAVLFGLATERDYGFGVKGYTYGYWDISGILAGLAANVTVNNTIGRRLGDCSAVNKTLTVVVDGGAPIDIVFNLDYTAVANASLLATINAALGSAAIADAYNPVNEIYPQMHGKQITLKNNSTTESIPAWSPCMLDTTRNTVRVMLPSDPASAFIGFNPFVIPPQTAKRILLEGYLQKIQAVGLSAATINYGTDISMSATKGTCETSSAKIIGKGAWSDWFYFKGNY